MGKNQKKREKKRKLEIVFDPKNRIEFLTGFRKRKNERKKRAKEDLERLLKEEKKRIRQEVKEGVKHLKKSYEPIPEFEDLLKEEYEDEKVTVEVLELSNREIATNQNWIGQNYPRYKDNDSGKESNEDSEEEEEVPGMSVTAKEKPQKVKEVSEKKDSVSTKKDIDKIKKKRTMKSIQKSKFFKMKQQFDKLANKKKSRKEKNKQTKELKKTGKRIPKKNVRKINFKADKRRKR